DQPRIIQLFQGDLSERSEATDADLLVVSAWQGNYVVTRHTVITALDRKGLSVAALAQDMQEDLRASFHAWLSKPLDLAPPLPPYKRLFCFEPPNDAEVKALVGDIFQGLMPFLGKEMYGLRSVAMPLVAAGDRGANPLDILEAILEAVVQWMAHGLPLEKLNIVEYSENRAFEMNGAFEILKRQYARFARPKRRFKYDLFVSYSHENTEEVLAIVGEMQRQRPDLEIFLDRQDLNTGSVWQQALYDALDNCAKVLSFYTPTYLSSKVCKEEFNIAVFRHRDSEEGVLIPVYLIEAALPTYMKLIQFIDARRDVPHNRPLIAERILGSL
ncbi:MAG TPA: toll/interleukin-1 receptor domain-containing protein, partial [Saprospiraceae bacterium]|nr:toll/interleukin-1 receptor domain-containing protein [Saprospiraceae bacterium]